MNGTCEEEEESVKDYLEYLLLAIAIIEQALSYSPEKYPKSISQVIVFIFYQFYARIIKPLNVEEPSNDLGLVDIVIKN